MSSRLPWSQMLCSFKQLSVALPPLSFDVRKQNNSLALAQSSAALFLLAFNVASDCSYTNTSLFLLPYSLSPTQAPSVIGNAWNSPYYGSASNNNPSFIQFNFSASFSHAQAQAFNALFSHPSSGAVTLATGPQGASCFLNRLISASSVAVRSSVIQQTTSQNTRFEIGNYRNAQPIPPQDLRNSPNVKYSLVVVVDTSAFVIPRFVSLSWVRSTSTSFTLSSTLDFGAWLAVNGLFPALQCNVSVPFYGVNGSQYNAVAVSLSVAPLKMTRSIFCQVFLLFAHGVFSLLFAFNFVCINACFFTCSGQHRYAWQWTASVQNASLFRNWLATPIMNGGSVGNPSG